MATPNIPLTSLAKSAGCAAKISQADLHMALARLPVFDDPRVLIGHGTSDDAAVVHISDGVALIETVDIFPPIVDDAFDFGRIAAANALSDVYAMGGKPLNALSFVAWPVDKLGLEPLGRLFEGAAEICRQAEIAISGGHSIVDEEPKFGLFITGTQAPDKIVSNSGARTGDSLVLTKKIGTGIMTTAVKRGRLQQDGLEEVIASMTALNRGASQAMIDVGVHAATDVTGFGLLGHLGNMLRASGAENGSPLGAEISYADVPLFEGVEEYLSEGLCPGGTKRNLEYAAPNTRFASHLDEARQLLMADAQTSGGLLIAVAPDRLDKLLTALKSNDTLCQSVIGHVVDVQEPGMISVN